MMQQRKSKRKVRRFLTEEEWGAICTWLPVERPDSRFSMRVKIDELSRTDDVTAVRLLAKLRLIFSRRPHLPKMTDSETLEEMWDDVEVGLELGNNSQHWRRFDTILFAIMFLERELQDRPVRKSRAALDSARDAARRALKRKGISTRDAIRRKYFDLARLRLPLSDSIRRIAGEALPNKALSEKYVYRILLELKLIPRRRKTKI